ncbi:hypothetical protein [Streptomyces sp. NPDC005244]|uniref:hypothetical protein n=1 Tax=Streptomyces sp. NPDC005244 TaxID=3364708 RepID=UPI0036B5B2D4
MTETEWCRLLDEKHAIAAAARKAGDATPEQKHRHREIQRRLAEIAAIPPAGYELPPLARGLVEFAREHGWRTLVQWTAPDYSGEPSVDVEVGRKLGEQEAKAYRSDTFHFKVTWHSRGCEPGKVKKFGAGLAQTPDHPQWRDGPSVRKIREIIHANPEPGAVTVHKRPISRAEFNAIPNARVLRFSFDWMNLRYAEWIEDAPFFGWSLMSDYGNPDDHCVVSRADSRLMAAERLTAFLAPGRAYGGDNLTVDEWEIAP